MEGPCFSDLPQIVERRSLHYASLRSAPVGTTEAGMTDDLAAWREDPRRFVREL